MKGIELFRKNCGHLLEKHQPYDHAETVNGAQEILFAEAEKLRRQALVSKGCPKNMEVFPDKKTCASVVRDNRHHKT